MRDNFDRWSFGITVGSAVAGLLLSAIAVVLALQAKHSAAAAETRAIGRATRERRILFELEILRDLVAGLSVENLEQRISAAFNFNRSYGGLIRFFPSELPTWHAIATMESQRVLYETFPDTPRRFIDDFDRMAKSGSVSRMYTPPGITTDQVRERLMSEVEAAIDPRMRPLD